MGEKTLEKPESRAFLTELCERFGTDEETLWRVVRDTCIKPNKAGTKPTQEQVILYLVVCKRYDLNPLMKEMYGFIDKDGQLVFGTSIDGWLKIANRHPQFKSLSVKDRLDENEQPYAATATVVRKDRDDPVEITEWLRECKRDTEPWRTRPVRMLRHKAVKEAIRYAFAITGLTDIEEAREAVRFSEGLSLGPAQSRTEAVLAAVNQHPAVKALPEGNGANGEAQDQQEPQEPPGEEEPYNSEESTDSGQPSIPEAPDLFEISDEEIPT